MLCRRMSYPRFNVVHDEKTRSVHAAMYSSWPTAEWHRPLYRERGREARFGTATCGDWLSDAGVTARLASEQMRTEHGPEVSVSDFREKFVFKCLQR